MSTTINCPSCGHGFPIEEVMTEEYKRELREKMNSYKKEKEEEVRKIMLQHERQLDDERKRIQLEMETSLRRTVEADFSTKIRMLESSAKENEEKLKQAREKELSFLQKEQALKQKEEELQLELQRKMQEQRQELSEQVRKQEHERYQILQTDSLMKQKEMEKQLDDQKRLIEEMKRKAEQGSMQLQGEVQELVLEELLRGNFPFDLVNEVGKGVRGADCVQTVRNAFGQECGRIIYESKRTKDFSPEWTEKLKKDMRSMGIDVAVIVSQCYPKGMDCFGERDGVWICSFDEVKAVAYVLRDSLLKLSALAKSQDNKGDKMHLLYDYLTGSEFNEQWKAIREGFMSMRLSIQRERDAMERLWKSREKQLEKVLLNAAGIRGSIEGIAGTDSIRLSLTDDEDEPLLLD